MAGSRSHSSLGASHGFAPADYDAALCKVPPLAAGATGDGAPYAPSPVALWVCGHLGINQAPRALFWSVACDHVSCGCPAHAVDLATLRRHWPGAVCPSAPKGLPQNRADRGHAAFGGAAHSKAQITVQNTTSLAVQRRYGTPKEKAHYYFNSGLSFVYLGWLMGLEPTTTGITI